MKDVKAMGSDVVPMEQEAKTLRPAIALLEKTFDRLHEIYSSSGGEPQQELWPPCKNRGAAARSRPSR